LKHQQWRYRHIGLVDEVGSRFLEAVKLLTIFDMVSEPFCAELYEMAAVYAHPLAAAAGRLYILRGNKSEVGDHEAFSLKNLENVKNILDDFRCFFPSSPIQFAAHLTQVRFLQKIETKRPTSRIFAYIV